MYVLFSDLSNAEAGSVLPTGDETVRFFDHEEDARNLLAERKALAESIVSRELSIIVENDYKGGVPYIFCYLLLNYPGSAQDMGRGTEVDIDETIEEFQLWDSIEDTTHVIKADKLLFEIPDKWQRENNTDYRWGVSDWKDG